MADYTVQLTPGVVNQVSEGSLDTSVRNGVSAQRTMEAVLMVVGEGDRKQLYRLADGEVYDDTIETPAASGIAIGNPEFASGTPVVSADNVTIGHPTASSDTGSTV